ncbi:FAD-dependent monooxygenase [Actinomadura rupiterrae]|uniref:FAD-dependent monooxygenase n=1 Tax=Actinomadura rupiterrae TaxID=559627 RepID=UPI0020A24D9E|nr:FAD-dependent monooxygenase [Actinomadura rupiterrae]MCP2343032.1 2-polyprenyl-6-methoxyphenol hydroxylase-like FAD-dependent oxidoreductase [Actinomadura rupiterrae]
MTKNILISGASVAGPALAYWLHRHGHAVTIVEKASELRDGGYAVDFRGEAHLRVLQEMGVLDDIYREQTRTGAMAYVNAEGKKLASMPADLFAGDVEILRGDLARILFEKTAPYTRYVFGDSIARMDEDPDGVTVTFDSGAVGRYDLVIGADGLHSNVRRLAFGPEEQYVSHLGLYCAIFTVPNYLGIDHAGLAFTTPGKVVTMYSARENTEAKAVFYFGAPLTDIDRRDVAAQQRLLAETFAGNGWESDRLLGMMADAPDFYFDSVSQVRMDTWTRGRIALLGDAAYCPSSLSGMGTGLAMVAAYVLAGELAEADGDHTVAFARYEELIREYVAGCQKQGQGVAKMMVPENRVVAWLLRQNYKLMPYLPGKKMIANSVRRTAENIALKTYRERRRSSSTGARFSASSPATSANPPA